MKDRLFLKVNCLDSARVQAEIDFNAVLADDFKGKSGQELLVFTTYSDKAAKDIQERYGMKEITLPFIVSHDGVVINKVKNVIMYLRREKMTKR